MTLEPDFREQTSKLIRDTLDLYKNSGVSPRVGEVWHTQNTGDFLCGFFVGEMVGSALSAFQIFHKREPSTEEHIEIVAIVENFSEEIRDFFSKFN
jgi:hypothetical protein